jgi:hypothetical protein
VLLNFHPTKAVVCGAYIALFYTPSVPFYNAYRFLAFVSEYKVVAWLFFNYPLYMREKNPYKKETIN